MKSLYHAHRNMQAKSAKVNTKRSYPHHSNLIRYTLTSLQTQPRDNQKMRLRYFNGWLRDRKNPITHLMYCQHKNGGVR